MLRRRLSKAAHDLLRARAHRAVEVMDAKQVRDAIHQAAPIPGRIFTLTAGEATQRKRIHDRLDAMTYGELRAAAGSRLPKFLERLLAWIDR